VSDELKVATPERVAVDLPIAGLGSRAMAYVVDVACSAPRRWCSTRLELLRA